MKQWFAAAAAAPILVACASAGAQTANAEDTAETRVLIVNGHRIMIDAEGDATSAIEEALDRSRGSRRVVVEFEDEHSTGWDEETRESFAEAMAGLAEAFASGFDGHPNFEFEFEDGSFAWNEDHERRIEVMVERIERNAERQAERLEREADRMALRAERMAARVERQAAHAERHGLRAGTRGVQAGLNSIDRILERGWYEEDGERVELTEDKRADLEETRAELLETLDELRFDLARVERRHGGEHREVRIVRRDGEARGWINGEEVTGSELDDLLAGAPDAPEPPAAPGGRD